MTVKRTAIDQVVLSMHLDKVKTAWGGTQNRIEVDGFEANAKTTRQCHEVQDFLVVNSFNWPKPVVELGEAVFPQVPVGTSFQALAW